MHVVFIEVSSEDHIQKVESLAKEIWTEHYTPIIGKAQVDYMLDRFQSQQAISEQIRSGFLYFLMKSGDENIGYIGVQPRGNELFLSKIYIKSSQRSRGYGKRAIHFAERFAREKRLRKISLTVNKNNRDSIKAYEKIGFKNVGSLIQEIGNGFIMDDYRMEKSVLE